jgi:MYXO-CTERM domain-containing protein
MLERLGHESSGEQYVGPDFTQDFHTFAVDWDAQRVIWYVDDVERFQHAGPGVPQVNMYVIANLAIGGGWPGAPDGTTPFPANYDVDYIRVYERSAGEDAGADGGVDDASAPSDGDVPDATPTLPDANPTDASPGDGGADSANADGGATDSGREAASGAGGGGSEEGDGCACRSGPRQRSTPGGFGLLPFLAALLLARRTMRSVRPSAPRVSPCTWR